MPKLNINGKSRDVQVEADTPLLWVIREQVGLTGTKYGCGVAQCGACSVHINGEVQRSCSIRVGDVKPGDRIVTIEGLSANSSHPVQKAWLAVDVPQCGYCQSGQIMAAAALLEEESQADRPGHRRRDDQHLPLRHLPARPRGGAHGGRQRHTATGRPIAPIAGREEHDHEKDRLRKHREVLAPQVHRRLRGRGRRRAGARVQLRSARRRRRRRPPTAAPSSASGSWSSPTPRASSASRARRWGRARSPASRSSSPKSWSATGRRSRPKASRPAATSRSSAPGATCRPAAAAASAARRTTCAAAARSRA